LPINSLKNKTMEKRTKKVLLISSALLLIGGGIYWLWKKKQSGSLPDASGDSTGGSTTDSTSGGSTGGAVVLKPNNTLAFQKFANLKGYTPKLKEDGVWGSKTAAAWSAWGSDYNKSIGITATSSFKKGQKVMPRIPLKTATAYDRKTGKAIGNVSSAIFEMYSTQPDKWFFGTVTVMPPANSPMAKFATTKSVQLSTKDWQ
jgi:hypothetical protein